MNSAHGSGNEVPFQIEFEGTKITAHNGDSVLVALSAAKIKSVSPVGNSGCFCNMGICHECRLIINGQRGQRACLTRAASGMRLERESM